MVLRRTRLLVAQSRRRIARPPGWRRGPAFGTNVDGLRGADVLVLFSESYSVYADDPVVPGAGRYCAALAAAIAASGHQVVSARVRSPTFGGGSWLAHAALLTGIDTRDPLDHDLLLSTQRPTLTTRRRPATACPLGTGPAAPLARGALLQLRALRVDAPTMGCTGLPFGAWQIPDQAAMAHARELSGTASTRAPRFIVFPAVGNRSLPPAAYVRGRASTRPGGPQARATASAGTWRKRCRGAIRCRRTLASIALTTWRGWATTCASRRHAAWCWCPLGRPPAAGAPVSGNSAGTACRCTSAWPAIPACCAGRRLHAQARATTLAARRRQALTPAVPRLRPADHAPYATPVVPSAHRHRAGQTRRAMTGTAPAAVAVPFPRPWIRRLRIATWNVNSLHRPPQRAGFVIANPVDVLATAPAGTEDERRQVPARCYRSSRLHRGGVRQKTYNGVAILSLQPVRDVAASAASPTAFARDQRHHRHRRKARCRLVNSCFVSRAPGSASSPTR